MDELPQSSSVWRYRIAEVRSRRRVAVPPNPGYTHRRWRARDAACIRRAIRKSADEYPRRHEGSYAQLRISASVSSRYPRGMAGLSTIPRFGLPLLREIASASRTLLGRSKPSRLVPTRSDAEPDAGWCSARRATVDCACKSPRIEISSKRIGDCADAQKGGWAAGCSAWLDTSPRTSSRP
jgi:hypothetical protein